MEPNKKFKLVSAKKTRYLLPNILTLGGVCLGISSIKFSIDGNFSLAVTLILLAAMIADGVSQVDRIYHLDRGAENFENKLKKIGVKIKRLNR